MMQRPKPVVLCILDGWGESNETDHNAIAAAHTPHWDSLRARYPFGTLSASQGDVGLPNGQMGNSEVGHMNIGAGRIVMQELPRIDAAVADGTLATNAELVRFIAALKASGGTCHLMGLVSDGGVHSHQSHMAALANILTAAGIPLAIHAFLDGRDVPPKSAEHAITQLCRDAPKARIATISGRYYAMDRDARWERIAKAYAALVLARGEATADAQAAITTAYHNGITDEFVLPTVLGDYHGMKDGDGILMTNFRADRARQLLTALTDDAFAGFDRATQVRFAATLGMVTYSDALAHIPCLFPQEHLSETLGELVANAGMKQLRIAETEKYAHVTFFFSGGREEPLAGEERILIPSPKVATYDVAPAMSAHEVTDRLVAAIESGQFDFIVVNYANTDMVGHSGNMNAAVAAVETVDVCLGRLSQAVLGVQGALLITADHGNAECMHDASEEQPHTAHTLNPVPCLVVCNRFTATHALPAGILADIAPTLLSLLGLPQPRAMRGRNLLAAIPHVSVA